MSILIKGMAMPKNCDECRIMKYEDTNCISVHELFCGCPIVFKAHPQHEEHRPDYCPLIELPPHGRLIDADALMEKAFRYNIHGKPTLKVVLASALRDAPTIIEAETCNETCNKSQETCNKAEDDAVNTSFPCDTCRFNPPSSHDGKPCTMCDTSNPLTNCYQKAEGEK